MQGVILVLMVMGVTKYSLLVETEWTNPYPLSPSVTFPCETFTMLKHLSDATLNLVCRYKMLIGY